MTLSRLLRMQLATRLVLMRRAERSIDLQYFLIKGDPAGHLFLY
jgi:hypothetical protein